MRRSLVAALFGAFLSAVVVAQQPATTGTPSPAAAASQPTAAQPAVPKLSDAEMEDFLLHAKVVKTKGISKGITGTVRATLTDGKITHDAHIQTIDERQQQFNGANGGVEFDFRDSWTFNIAGYEVDRLIGMNLVPVSVERRWNYKDAAFTWWLDDVMMDEQERLKRKQEPADVGMWNQQMQMVRVFDELIANVDRNLGNLIISKDWRLWPIDHTRAFRTNHELKKPANVTRADRAVVERMKALDKETLRKATSKYLTTFQIDAILARRDAIVKRLDSLGPASLYDRSGW
ncbi:MAG TPA: hypothetical protein VL882_26715 [Vicinamibacterales bacterium]|jgi:hypothetical protein|nr:hypothetical protein [Vicinamibacterales bacterium]